jgi:SAM-dependent methyltransferase
MARAESAVRALSFGGVADVYDRYRPGPPMSVVEWVLRTKGGRVADVGAGTGALTRQLAKQADWVVAVEPDIRMLGVLRAHSPQIPGVQAWAEHLPLRSRSLDALTVSSAWHWMDRERTLDEIARVLRPGGVFGVIWNGAIRSVGWVGELLGRNTANDEAERSARHRFELPAGAPFAELEENTITWSKPMNQEELVGLARTYSMMITATQEDRERELARIEAAASSLVGTGQIDVPMGCRCWRAVRA